MRGLVQTFCDIVLEHWWTLIGVSCGIQVYRCVRCEKLMEEHE
jgi:hypothetical protein